MRIAVIGSGISGLSSAWLLSRDQRFQVSLFEAQSRFGGHSNTVDVELHGTKHPVDTGFLVHNPNTYPHLLKLFECLQVKTIETDMSFSVSLIDLGLEWAGTDLSSVFADKKNLVRPRFWRMIFDIIKFNKKAPLYLQELETQSLSLGELLKEKKYSQEFISWYLIPMGAAIWSSTTKEMLKFPASTFIHFCINHSLLQVEGRPKWRTMEGGSRVYVNKMISEIPNAFANEAVLKVEHVDLGLKVTTAQRAEVFDKVIFACHSDQILEIFPTMSEVEKNKISKIRYQKNQAFLHWDRDLLPRSEKVWSAWNYQSQTDVLNNQAVSVTYLINKLQPLPFSAPVMVTLNPFKKPAEEKTIRVIPYEHPVFDGPAIDAQKSLDEIQNLSGALYAGAWCGYGFHEDGLKAGIKVAKLLGAKIPWQA